MEIYNASVAGNVEQLKNIFEVKKYSPLEECSAGGYYWTALHYAAHYGFENVINYYLEYFERDPNKQTILNMQSSTGLPALFICLNSKIY
jgi:hypothetical protein